MLQLNKETYNKCSWIWSYLERGRGEEGLGAERAGVLARGVRQHVVHEAVAVQEHAPARAALQPLALQCARLLYTHPVHYPRTDLFLHPHVLGDANDPAINLNLALHYWTPPAGSYVDVKL